MQIDLASRGIGNLTDRSILKPYNSDERIDVSARQQSDRDSRELLLLL